MRDINRLLMDAQKHSSRNNFRLDSFLLMYPVRRHMPLTNLLKDELVFTQTTIG